jgi:hypothetical protein
MAWIRHDFRQHKDLEDEVRNQELPGLLSIGFSISNIFVGVLSLVTLKERAVSSRMYDKLSKALSFPSFILSHVMIREASMFFHSKFCMCTPFFSPVGDITYRAFNISCEVRFLLYSSFSLLSQETIKMHLSRGKKSLKKLEATIALPQNR